MHLNYMQPLTVIFMIAFVSAHHPNNISSDAMYPLDTENITHGQLNTPLPIIAACVPPYCYDIINKTVNDIENSNPKLVTASSNSMDDYQSERLNSDIFERHSDDRHWSSTSVMYGLLMLANRDYVNEQCHTELRMIYNGIRRREIWAIKVLDSSGSPEPGFILGHNFWLGSIRGCEAVQHPHTITISNRYHRHMHDDLLRAQAPFDTNYRVMYASHKSPWQIEVEFVLVTQKVLHVGLCLPSSCTNEEVFNITQEYFDRSHLQAQRLFEHQPNVLEVKELKVKTNFMQKASVQIIGFCLTVSIVMGIFAHFYNAHQHTNEIEENNQSENGAKDQNGNRIKQLHSMDWFIQCFSLVDNFKMITSTSKSPNALPVVDGLKSVGCFLVLIFHMHWFMHYAVNNTTMTFAYGEQAAWQWVSATPIIVDVFFTISGLLLTYNFLRDETKIKEIQTNNTWQNLKLFGKQLFHRYMRLTPFYLIVVGTTEIATTYLVETSPFWVHDRFDKTCSKYWWRNVLYIQNFFAVEEYCVNWTWSMACEMQFFVIVTALLFLYAKNEKLAKKVFFGLFAGFSAFVFGVAVKHEFTPAYDVMHKLGNELYTSPFTRILPYLVGTAAGWILYTTRGKMPFQEKTIKMMWALSTTIFCMSHLCTLYRGVSYLLAAPLISAIRIFYPSSVAWMILASTMGNGGPFARILNYPVFVHLNKLSYGIYLLNPLIITVIYGMRDSSTHVDPMSASVMTVGVMVIVYLFSLVCSLLFEVPYTKLSTQLLKEPRKKKVL